MSRIWLILLVTGPLAVFAPTLGSAQQAPPLREGRSIYQLAPAPPLPPVGCLTTIDRVRQERVWDPLCDREGAGLRPGPGD
jgi:hypothetical protein